MKNDWFDFFRSSPLRTAFDCGSDWQQFERQRPMSRHQFRNAARDFMKRQWQGKGWGFGEEWGPFGSFAGGPRPRFFEFGEARLAILSLLQEGPKHGYQLIKELEQRSGGLYRASAGTVYPTLQQLEDEQFLKYEEIDGRKIYSLTPQGHQEVEREKEAIARIWKRAESWGQWTGPSAFSFMGPLGSFLKGFFRAARWADDNKERQERVLKIIEKAKTELKELCEE